MARYLNLVRILLPAAILISAVTSGSGQVVTSGAGSGNWNDPLSWTPNGIPTAAGGSITINHAITVTDAGRNGDQMVISGSGSLTINAGITFTVNAGAGDDLTVNSGGVVNILTTGTLQIQFAPVPPPPSVALVRVFGAINNAGAISNASTGALIFEAGSNYDHLYTTSAGVIPTASWNVTSTCSVTGYTTNTSPPTGLGQSFGNFVWNTPSLSGFIDLNGALTTVNGSLTITNVPGSYIYLTISTSHTLTVGADLTISNSSCGLNSGATVVINVGGNALFSNNTDLNPTFSGNVTLNVTGDIEFSGGTTNMTYTGGGSIPINVGGDFSLTSSPTINNGGSGTYILTFNGSGTQNYIASQDLTDYNFVVLNGSRVDVANGNYFSGPGSFTLQAGATLGVAGANGLSIGTSSGIIRVSGTRTYTANSNIIYNGGIGQNLGDEWGGSGALNGIAVNLEIANTGGGVINNIIGSTSLVGNLTLTSGALNIGNSNTLQIQSDFNGNGGTLGGLSTSNLTFSGSGSITGLLSFASGSRNLNNFTINRGGTINLGSDLTIAGTLSFASTGNLDFDQFNGQTLVVNGDITQSGSGGLVSGTNFTSNLSIGGSGVLTSLPFCTTCGSMQLNNLTFNRTGGSSYTWNSSVTILNAVNLNSGTLTHTAGLTMGVGSTFNRSSGATISAVPLNSGAYNVAYNGTLTTGPELPSSTVALSNLTVGGDVSLNKDITVNGVLTFSSGTFNAGSQIIDLKGNLVSNSSSTLTGSDFTFSGTTTISGISAPVFGDVTTTGTLTPSADFNMNGNLVNNGTLNAGSATVTFGGTTTISGGSTHNFNNVSITGTLNGPANLNVSGNWNNTGTFNRGIASNTVTFNGTTSFTGNGLTQFSSILVDNGAILNSRPVLPLNVAGNFTNNGTFNASTGAVLLNGTSLQSIAGTTATTFNNITVTNAANPLSVRVQSNQNIRGILTLSANSVFDADGSDNTSIFTLLSSDDEPSVVDAAIAALPAGAQVQGNVTVQRYMSIEGGSNSPAFNDGRVYRYISSPVQNATVVDLQNEIPVTGTFTTSSSCSGCGSTQSMFLYNEAEIGDTNGSGGNDANDGYEDFPQNLSSETFSQGRGYSVFVRGNVAPVSSSGNARYDLTGPINSGTVDFASTAGVSFTSSTVTANDGWNLIGNPYPSTIDWLSGGWSKSANVTNAIYMLDNGSASGTFATFINGVGSNGGSQYIPIGQAFWVKLDAAGTTTLTANETVKTPGQVTEFFRQAPPNDLLRITLRNGNLRDEAVVYFDENAKLEFDSQLDALKLDNNIFNLFTTSPEGSKFAISSVPQLDCAFTTDLQISNTTPGTYSLDFSEFESFTGQVDIILRDRLLSTVRTINSDPLYEFEVTGEEDTYQDRFELTIINREINPSLIVEVSDAENCKQGFVTLEADGAPADGSYKWYENDSDLGPITGAVTNSFTTPVLSKSKTYYVSAVSALGCEGPRVPVVANIVNFDDSEIGDLPNGVLSSNFEMGNQWFKDGILITGATNQTFNPTESGLYKVEVSIGSCKTSSERVFTVTGLEDEGSFDKLVVVYPNPVSSELIIRTSKKITGNAKIIDVSGKVIGDVEMKKNGGALEGSFDFGGSADGIYLIQISDEKGTIYSKRIIKK